MLQLTTAGHGAGVGRGVDRMLGQVVREQAKLQRGKAEREGRANRGILGVGVCDEIGGEEKRERKKK